MSISVVKRRQYTEEDFLTAYEAIKRGMSAAKASKLYKVPKATLSGRIKHGRIQRRKHGPPTLLTEDEELRLVEWILKCWRAGFTSCREREIGAQARQLLQQSGRQTTRQSEFGRYWFPNFQQRHTRIKQVMDRRWKAEKSDWQFDCAQLKLWFQHIGDYLNEVGLEQVLQQSKRLFHCMQLTFPHASVIFSYSADGMATPPLLVLPPGADSVKLALPKGWSRHVQAKAQLDMHVLEHYLQQVLQPYLLHAQVELPVIVFLDHQQLTPSFEFFELCRKLDVVIVNLYNLAFHKLRRLCKQRLMAWQTTSPAPSPLEYADFLEQLKDTICCTLTKTNMRNAFSSSGLHPFGIEGVDTTVLAKDKTESTAIAADNIQLEEATQNDADGATLDLLDFQELLGPQLLNDLQQYNDAECGIKQSAEFLALHTIYKRLQQVKVTPLIDAVD